MAARLIVEYKHARFYGKVVNDMGAEELQSKIYDSLENLNKLTLELDDDNMDAPYESSGYLLIGPKRIKDCLFFVVDVDE